ncbi:MAG: sulfatase-like hydrolase/transferase [Helicobacteraceae bacterium]|jgi:phosphoglycerol transferase MdoB-like AlkP superfamily enzyme|nr:sulfatase-like hydrolase/transferase [Helicobacteraceae bacterium]
MKRQNTYWLALNLLAIFPVASAFFVIYKKASFAVIPSFSIMIGEIIACLALAALARRFGKIALCAAALFMFAVLIINAAQTLSIVKSGALLDSEAFANAEHIGFMIDAVSLSITAIFLAFGAIAVLFLLNAPRISPIFGATPFAITAVFLIAVNSVYILKNAKYTYQANKVSYTLALFKTLIKENGKSNERIVLNDQDLNAAERYGWTIEQNASFPILNIGAQETATPEDAPNIIILFVESLSADLIGAYGGGGRTRLTPNIDRFATDNVLIANYYNHAFPTIVGLKGQLCSTYPSRTAGEWQNMLVAPRQALMRCLPTHLNEAGYKSVYLGYSHPSYTFFEEQMKATGFTETLFFEDLSKRLLDNEPPELGRYGLGDRQMLTALINYLKNYDEKEPIFIAVSTVGTHPGLDSQADRFGDGNSRVLNVLHRFDQAFGEFISAYDGLDFKRETILILTADHAHLPSVEFVDAASADFVPSRLNKIAFILAFKNAKQKTVVEANATSIDLAKTVLALAGINSITYDHLLGSNMLGENKSPKTIGSYGDELLIVDRLSGEVNRTDFSRAKSEERLLRYIKSLEQEDRVCCDQEAR